MEYRFINQANFELSGNLELPIRKNPLAYLLFIHCFTCGKEIGAARQITRHLARLGFAVLRFDFTGIGSSQGDFSNSNYTSNVEDILSAYEALTQSHQAPTALIGHSLGGSAALAASLKLPLLKAVVTIGAPSRPTHVEHLFKTQRAEIEQRGEAEIVLGNQKIKIKKQFLTDLEEQNFLDQIKNSKKNYLIMHSPVDQIVSIENAGEIFQNLRHPKSFISLDRIDHLVHRKKDAVYLSELISAWLLKLIPEPLHHFDTPESTSSRAEEVIAEEHHGVDKKRLQNLYTSNHHFYCDQPIKHGGNGMAPTPSEYFLAALNACTSMTIRLYANHKKFSLESIRVNSKLVKKSEEEKNVQKIIRSIFLKGNLSREERNKIIKIANRCPIHQLISTNLEIVTEEFTDN